MKCYPILFQPIYKDYIWGGNKINTRYHRHLKEGVYAESWEISDRIDDMSLVLNGEYQGKTLRELIQMFTKELMGALNMTRFPLLIKLIDARENLSIQVHPDDKAAIALDAEAKTEAWVILDADNAAKVYVGFKANVTQASYQEALKLGRVEELMNQIDVQKGDVLLIPGGRVHAIGSGCLLYEVQQNSNTTYRIYDWDRVSLEGKPRELHLKEAFQVIHWEDIENPLIDKQLIKENKSYTRFSLLKTHCFELEHLLLHAKFEEKEGHKSAMIFFVEEGSVKIEVDGEKEELQQGATCLVPASAHHISIEAMSASAQLLRTVWPC